MGGVLPEGTVMTCATGAYGTAIAECMLAGLFMLQKNMLQYMDNQKKHVWEGAGMTKSICGATGLCVGAGDIGGEFLKRCKALGAYTIGVRRDCSEKPEYMDELYMIDQVDELLPKADVVASVLPETPKTINLFNEERLSKLRSDAIFINVGRGTTVDNVALARLLEEGKVGGAVLDVFEKEPLKEDDPIYECPNLLMTPHASGSIQMAHTVRRTFEIFYENLDNYLHGRPMFNVVDQERGY
jgi:phosphoglycerate dehydrogenase-like enzyme